jgi:hypothetical protein
MIMVVSIPATLAEEANSKRGTVSGILFKSALETISVCSLVSFFLYQILTFLLLVSILALKMVPDMSTFFGCLGCMMIHGAVKPIEITLTSPVLKHLLLYADEENKTSLTNRVWTIIVKEPGA